MLWKWDCYYHGWANTQNDSTKNESIKKKVCIKESDERYEPLVWDREEPIVWGREEPIKTIKKDL